MTRLKQRQALYPSSRSGMMQLRGFISNQSLRQLASLDSVVPVCVPKIFWNDSNPLPDHNLASFPGSPGTRIYIHACTTSISCSRVWEPGNEANPNPETAIPLLDLQTMESGAGMRTRLKQLQKMYISVFVLQMGLIECIFREVLCRSTLTFATAWQSISVGMLSVGWEMTGGRWCWNMARRAGSVGRSTRIRFSSLRSMAWSSSLQQ